MKPKSFLKSCIHQLSDRPFLALSLELNHTGINTVFGKQFLGLSLFSNRPFRQDNNLIRTGYGTHSMGDKLQYRASDTIRQDIPFPIPLVDYTKIILNEQSVILPNVMQIDLGSVAKGYTGDVIADLLREGGVVSAILNLGGNVHTIGTKQDGSPWKIAVADPFAPELNLISLDITDAVVITSGNYERYFMGQDGKRYCHIIDSKTGYPADNGIVSMTIVGDYGLTCDAMSTALYAAGAEKAVRIWRETGKFEMIYVTDDKTIYLTEGLKDSFANLSGLPRPDLRTHGNSEK